MRSRGFRGNALPWGAFEFYEVGIAGEKATFGNITAFAISLTHPFREMS